MNNKMNFSNQQNPQRIAQALENYVLPEQKFQMPQTPSANGISPMDVVKMMGKKKPEIGTGMTPDSASMLPF
jgi:uncharacterized UBP type Zn finger protein